jgi:hypothetical protein
MTTSLRPALGYDDPGALIAALPGMLSFHPTDSIILLTYAGDERPRLESVLRMDLPLPEHVADVAAQLRLVAANHGACVVEIVMLGGPGADPPIRLPYRNLVEHLDDLFEHDGITLAHAAWSSTTRPGATWWCYEDPECTGQVHPATHPLLTHAGSVPFATRDEMARLLAPDPDELLAPRAAALSLEPDPIDLEATYHFVLETIDHLNPATPPSLADQPIAPTPAPTHDQAAPPLGDPTRDHLDAAPPLDETTQDRLAAHPPPPSDRLVGDAGSSLGDLSSADPVANVPPSLGEPSTAGVVGDAGCSVGGPCTADLVANVPPSLGDPAAVRVVDDAGSPLGDPSTGDLVADTPPPPGDPAIARVVADAASALGGPCTADLVANVPPSLGDPPTAHVVRDAGSPLGGPSTADLVSETPPPLDDPTIVRLARALATAEIREACLAMPLTHRAAAAEHLWLLLTRAVPGQLRAHPASLLAVSVFLRGNGTLASMAVDVALAANPAHHLTNTLRHALDCGIPPSQFRAMLAKSLVTAFS